MATLAAVADALADTIATATGLRTTDHIPGDVNPPALFVCPSGGIERGAMNRGQMEVTFDAHIFTSRTVDRVGQQALYDYATFDGTKSVWKAVDDTPTLGLSGTNAAVLGFRFLGIEEVSALGYWGGAFQVLVLTTGSS